MGRLASSRSAADPLAKALPVSRYVAYARSAAAELAVVAKLPDAQHLLDLAMSDGDHPWAARPAWPARPGACTTTPTGSPSRPNGGNGSAPEWIGR